MQEWRHVNGIPEDMSQVPQPYLEEIKGWFRHGVQCTTHKGHPVWLMKVWAPLAFMSLMHAYQWGGRE